LLCSIASAADERGYIQVTRRALASLSRVREDRIEQLLEEIDSQLEIFHYEREDRAGVFEILVTLSVAPEEVAERVRDLMPDYYSDGGLAALADTLAEWHEDAVASGARPLAAPADSFERRVRASLGLADQTDGAYQKTASILKPELSIGAWASPLRPIVGPPSHSPFASLSLAAPAVIPYGNPGSGRCNGTYSFRMTVTKGAIESRASDISLVQMAHRQAFLFRFDLPISGASGVNLYSTPSAMAVTGPWLLVNKHQPFPIPFVGLIDFEDSDLGKIAP